MLICILDPRLNIANFLILALFSHNWKKIAIMLLQPISKSNCNLIAPNYWYITYGEEIWESPLAMAPQSRYGNRVSLYVKVWIFRDASFSLSDMSFPQGLHISSDTRIYKSISFEWNEL